MGFDLKNTREIRNSISSRKDKIAGNNSHALKYNKVIQMLYVIAVQRREGQVNSKIYWRHI